MRNFLKKILLIINILLAVFLLITLLSARISPATAWIFAFIALSYPFFLIVNILFVLWWIIFRKWFFIISLICILVGWQALQSTFQIKFKKTLISEGGNTIKLLTYNVRLFNYYQWDKDTSAWQKIVDYIHTEDPDIVCFQEFITLPRTHHDFENLKRNLEHLQYTHVYYTDQIPGRLNFGMATFSRYPIINKKMIDFEESLNGSICSDIVIRKDTIRIYNCHLQSIRLRKDYNDVVDSLIFNYSDKQLDELREMSVRMRQAFIQRADQVDILSDDLRKSPFPVIVCGDFNDTPVSYAYRTLSGGLKDAFIESGSGTGATFRGNFPYVRIDYILYSSGFSSGYYHTDKVDWSDHYPVITHFRLNEKADSSDQHSRLKE